MPLLPALLRLPVPARSWHEHGHFATILFVDATVKLGQIAFLEVDPEEE